MSTPILVDRAKRIADATVNDVLEATTYGKVKFEVTLGNLLHALLDYASRDMLPNNCSGLRYTAAVIYGAYNENRLIPVARVWLEVKLARTSITTYPTSSYDQMPPDLSERALMVQPWARTTHTFREKLLIRQDYRCAVDRRKVDRESNNASRTTLREGDKGRVGLRLSHIIQFPLSQLFQANEKEPKKPSVTWTLLKHWTSNNIQLIVDSIDNPSKGLLMEPGLHEQFQSFYLYFLPVADQPNTYTVHTVGYPYPYPLVTFHSRGGVGVPSPKLLAVHAALAEVLNVSGFGDYFEEVWDSSSEGIAVMDRLTFKH